MIKIIGGRGVGKTTKLIEVSSERQIPILCRSQEDKLDCMTRATTLGLKIPTPLVFDKEKPGRCQVDVLVDDLDFLASCIFQAYGYKIQGYSLTNDDVGVEIYEV